MTYTSGNRLATYNGEAIEYDADGNMITGPLAGEMSSYTYDSRNRLLTAGNLSYQYDAENNRTAVNDQQSGTRTDYIINPNTVLSQVLAASDANGSTYYVYGLGLIGQENPDGAYQTYHYDLRGSTVALTDQTGEVTDRYQYGPYGEMVKHEGKTITPFQYCGQYGVMTDSNGIAYMRARYYNPEIRRFVNQDVLIGSIDDSQSLNRFAYVNGEPISSVDPFGLFSLKNSFNKAKQAVNKGLKKAKQIVNKGVDWLTKPSTLKTIKKVAAVTGGVAAVAGLVVASPVIGAVGGVSLVASVVTTGVTWYQDKQCSESKIIKKYVGDLALDIAPAGLGRLSKAMGGGKTLIKMASETKLANSVAAAIDIDVAAYSVGNGVRDMTELLFNSNRSINNPKTVNKRKKQPIK